MGANRRKAVRERKKRRLVERRKFAKKVAERLLGKNPITYTVSEWKWTPLPPKFKADSNSG